MMEYEDRNCDLSVQVRKPNSLSHHGFVTVFSRGNHMEALNGKGRPEEGSEYGMIMMLGASS